jgi:hypothetical protein
MDRRLFVTGFFGAAGAAALAVVMPPHAETLAGIPLDDPTSGSNVLPNLEDLKADPDEAGQPVPESGEQLAYHYGVPHGRRRRRRVRRWRRICRREWWNGIYRRRCRRRPFWIWLSIG